MNPNNRRTLKSRVFQKSRLSRKGQFSRRIARIAKKFDLNTQQLRNEVILDLKVLLEIAYEQATKIKERAKPTEEHRKWAELATRISKAIGLLAKEYDAAKITRELNELWRMAAELERKRKEGN